jgi:BirA family biotin operon repressor/biotin-[acetyl-CoA-carboxylase] ligase
MGFPLSADVAARLDAVAGTASTNDDLVGLAGSEALPEFAVVVTLSQSAGRGRLGRTWEAPPGTSLAASVLLRPQDHGMGLDRYGWIPLLAGLAMTRAVRQLVPDREVALKWPNDVLIEGRKVCGVLSELLPDGATVVVGSGLNLTIPRDALPVPTATSLLLEGVGRPADELADLALARYLGELKRLWGAFSAGADAGRDGIRVAVSGVCSTLGQDVRVALPGGGEHLGTAIELDEAGRLLIRTRPGGRIQAVAAGDVTHLRYE